MLIICLRNRNSDIRLDKKVVDRGVTEFTSATEIECTFRNIDNENEDRNHSASKRLRVGSSIFFFVMMKICLFVILALPLASQTTVDLLLWIIL